MRFQYISVRALAEPIRMMCRYGGLDIEDETFDVFDFVNKTREEKRVYSPTEQLPALHVVDGEKVTVISQSGACMRFLATTIGGGLYPTDPLERARADIVFETAQEMFVLNPICNMLDGDTLAAREREFWDLRPTAFPRRMEMAERMLEETSAFFVGKDVTYADFQARSHHFWAQACARATLL